MKSHYTANELAGLPGIPSTERSVQRTADRETWPSQKRAGRGGGKEYALASLPVATRDHLMQRHMDKVTTNLPAVHKAAPVPALAAKPAATPVEALPGWQRRCLDARLAILRLVKAAVDSGFRVKAAIHKIIEAATNGELGHLQALVPLANARAGKSGSRTLSERTLLRWWAAWRQNGFDMAVLVPDGERQPRPEPVWATAFLAAWKRPQKPALTDVLTALNRTMPAHIPMPSYDQARRYLATLGALECSKGRCTGIELMALKPHRRRLTDHMFPGDCYTADGHCTDNEVAHPYHGRPFRPEVTPVIDIATRMVVGWSCDLAESGLAVLDALRCACEQFGPPVIFYTDNGSGFKNQMMTAPGTGILARLGITPEYSRPRNPQAHGISERAHQTILIKAAKQLCTYIGHDMDDDAKQLVYPVRGKMEDKQLRIPYKPEIRADLRAVTKETTPAGNIRFTAERSENGHADRFWALALAIHAAGNYADDTGVLSGSPRESFELMERY
jgi:putative transposase